MGLGRELVGTVAVMDNHIDGWIEHCLHEPGIVTNQNIGIDPHHAIVIIKPSIVVAKWVYHG